MLKVIKFTILLSFLALLSVVSQGVFALELADGLVISQVQLGDSASASNELIQLYNNSANDIDVTDWCLYYASASSSLIGNKLVCFLAENISSHIYIPGFSTILLVSNQYLAANSQLQSDYRFSATLAGSAGHIRLLDKDGVEVDKIGWGSTAISAEGLEPTEAATPGTIIKRKYANENVLQDTNINSQDFGISEPNDSYSFGYIYYANDVCLNLNDVQLTVPDGYDVDIDNNCNELLVDYCANIDDIQLSIPVDYYLLGNDCLPIFDDICLNLDGIQSVVPNGYVQIDEKVCLTLPINITELLPNAINNDIGNEYIEIFNPNDVSIDLSNYNLYIGLNGDKKYNFLPDSYVASKEYKAIYNSELKFNLVNTTSKVQIRSSEGDIIDETAIYTTAKDGLAWALIDNLWQYTNRPTPDEPNILSDYEPTASKITVSSLIQPCPTGQERNPLTNRCRLIASQSTLVPCKDGQYRSEETNRCRNIVSDVATMIPCGEGQERNPETNRCRNVSSGSVLGSQDLVPCKEGQERNPETNRCRNIIGEIAKAEYAPQQLGAISNDYTNWWALGGVGALAITYGIWEWRQEIRKVLQRLSQFMHFNK